jgi:microcin C transport system substrate-binding protein
MHKPFSRLIWALLFMCSQAALLLPLEAAAVNLPQPASPDEIAAPTTSPLELSRLYAIGEGNDGQYPLGFEHFDYAKPDASKGGTLRLSAIGSFSNLEPFSIHPAGVDADLLYDRLFFAPRDDPLTSYPLVARSVVVADDRSSAVFNLDPKAHWHDGSPITSEDVVFTFELLTRNEHALPYFRTAFEAVTGAEAVDPLKVKFSFRPTDEQSTIFLISSMHVLSKNHYATRKFGGETLEAPLGSGPYQVAQVLPGQRIVYRRVNDYWAQDLPVRKGMFNFDTWIVDYYRDADTRAQAFMAGLIDMVVEFNPARWSLYDDVRASNGYRLRKTEAPLAGALGSMNFAFNLRRPPFDDRLIREAITALFDYEWINRILLAGWARRNYSQFPNSDLAAIGRPTPAELTLLLPWKDHLRKEILDQEYIPPVSDGSGYQRVQRHKALELFGKAGYTIRNGRLVNGAGRQLSVEIMTANAESRSVLQAFVASLRRVGIDASLRLVDTPQFEQRSRVAFDFDMTFHFVRSTDLPGPEREQYWGSEFANKRYTVNIAGVRDPVVDDLVGKIAHASTREDLVAASRALDRVLMWNAYLLPGWYIGTVHYAYWDRLGRPEPMAASPALSEAVSPEVGWPAVETWWRK